MKRMFWVGLAAAAAFAVGPMTAGAEKAPQEVVDLAETTLVKMGTDPVIVEAVKAKNAQGETLDQVKAKDQEWQDHAGVADYMQAMMESDCGRRLREIQESAPYYAEIFVMDAQGANVAMTNKTSDYWQGDEAKFRKSFNGGKGELFVDEVEFDQSAQCYVVQVSVPVMDGGEAIGAVTFGIDLDQLE